MKEKKKKEKKNTLPILCMVGPTSLWLLFFLLIPLIYVVVISFMTKGAYGGVVGKFSIDSYKKIFDPLYLTVMWKSVVMAFETSVICLIISYPFAYMLCKVNGLIRLNGWSNILRDSGFVNTLLMKIGIIDQPIQMMYSEGAVLFGMVYTFFPFMVLPLQSSISKLDHSLVEASYDLGARKIKTFIRVILPMTLPGIFAGTIQVFIPSLGAFFISDVMGGGSAAYLGNLIQNQFLVARNWPLGAAFSVLLIIFTLVVLKAYSKVGDLDDLA